MKKSLSIITCFLILFSACTPKDFQDILNGGVDALSSEDVALGLKEALTQGVSKGVNVLSATDGFLKSAYKIGLPEEAQKVVNTLEKIPGFNNVEDQIITKLNHAAEDASKGAKTIFVSAIRQMTFQDAWNILKGEQNAATQFLERTTRQQLYNNFQPVVLESLNKFNAVDYWADAVNTYNSIPLVNNKANPRIDDHVTEKALDGLFKMVAKEELAIRKDPINRVTDLLKRVFSEQD